MAFSLSGLLKKVPVVGGIAGGLVGAAGGALNTRAANKNAKIDAKNQNAANAWQHKLDVAQFNTREKSGLEKTGRGNSFRRQIAAAIANNPKYGLQNLLPGFFKQEQAYTPTPVINPYEAAGAPPEMQAQKQSMLGGILSGAAGGAVQGAQAANYFRRPTSASGE